MDIMQELYMIRRHIWKATSLILCILRQEWQQFTMENRIPTENTKNYII